MREARQGGGGGGRKHRQGATGPAERQTGSQTGGGLTGVRRGGRRVLTADGETGWRGGQRLRGNGGSRWPGGLQTIWSELGLQSPQFWWGEEEEEGGVGKGMCGLDFGLRTDTCLGIPEQGKEPSGQSPSYEASLCVLSKSLPLGGPQSLYPRSGGGLKLDRLPCFFQLL